MSANTVPSVVGASVPQSNGKRVLLAEPRGYCAGVDRAVEAVEQALKRHGAPVYVRHEIVHNRHVVAALAERGAIFVEDTDEVPPGSVVVFSAHGVSPAVREVARQHRLQVIDATCPLVTKVHNEVIRFARRDYDILLIGHQGHEEVEGDFRRGSCECPHCGRGRSCQQHRRARRVQADLVVSDDVERR